MEEQESTGFKFGNSKSSVRFNDPNSTFFRKSVSSKFNSALKSRNSSVIKDSNVIDLESGLVGANQNVRVASSNFENLEDESEEGWANQEY